MKGISEELKHFQILLLQKRKESLEKLEQLHRANLTLKKQHHPGDFTSAKQEVEMNFQLIERTREYILHIDKAFQRIENKTCGICLATGKPVSKEQWRPFHTLVIAFGLK